MIALLFCLLAIVTAVYLRALFLRVRSDRSNIRPRAETLMVGSVVAFFDTLGIGAFAPTTAYIKFRRLVPDKFIPGTMIAGLALPTVAQAFIFIQIIEVDVVLLFGCIGAAVAGSLVGAGFAERLPTRHVQIVMGVGLLVAAIIYGLSNLGLLPAGGAALALPPLLLAAAIAAHFVLGLLMNLGIGLYAPALILLSLMGLDPRAAFPIMMGACAFLMPGSSVKILPNPGINLRVVIALALGGIPAVLVAAFLVESLPLETLRWLVVGVVAYASILMLRSAWRREEGGALQDVSAPTSVNSPA